MAAEEGPGDAHCHPDVEDVPEQRPEASASPASRWKDQDWRHFFLVFLSLAAVLGVASFAAYSRSTPLPTVELAPGATIYYNQLCSDCAPYLDGELRPSLAAVGVSPIVVKDYVNQPAFRRELAAIHDSLGVPYDLQGHLATFVLVGRNVTVFEGHVPAATIREALTMANRTDRLLVHQDLMDGVVAYHAWAFAGKAQEYALGTSLSVYTTWFAANVPEAPTSPPLLPLVLATGFVDGLNPCAFAVLLFFISFLYVSRRPRIELARIGVLYIFAVFLAYFLIGLGLLAAISVSSDPHFLARVAGALVAALGVFVLVQPYLPGIPNPFHTPKFAWEGIRKWMFKGTQPAAAVSGFLVGLCTFPCSGGIYVAVLGLVAANTTYWEGLGYLYLYNLAFVLPLVIILVVVSNRALARRATTWERGHTNLIRRGAAVAMIVVGLATVFLV